MTTRAVYGVLLCALAVGAVEPGLPSKTSILTTVLRAIGTKNPDPEFRNPDYLAVNPGGFPSRYAGPRFSGRDSTPFCR
jgi:hypothetical protein